MTQIQAMLCAFAAFFAWVVMDAGVKWGSQSPLSPIAIMGVLGIVGTLGVVGMAARKRDFACLVPRHPREQIILCLCSLTINYAFIIALKHLPLTIYYIVVFTAPLVVAVLSSILKHEILTVTKVTCLVSGFVGVIIAVAPHASGSGEWIGYLASGINVMCFAVMTVVTRKISATASTESIMLPSLVVYGVIGIIGGMFNGGFPMGKALVVVTIAAAVNMIGNFLYNKALKYTSSTNVMQLHYS
jgi:drug/metabolite transporter (DMT)-like permease